MNKKKFALFGIIISASFMLGFFLNCFISNDYVFHINLHLLFSERTFAFSGFFMAVFLLLFLSRKYKRIEISGIKKTLQGTDEDKRIDVNLEQARFQTEIEIDNNFSHRQIIMPNYTAFIQIFHRLQVSSIFL